MSTFLTCLDGQNIYENVTYKVAYRGVKIPRWNNGVWKFTHKGRGGVAHGSIVWHSDSSVLNKYQGEDLYLSAKWEGTITEVRVDLCVGYGEGDDAVACGYGPATVIRVVGGAGEPRCDNCELEHKRWEANEATRLKQKAIEDALAAGQNRLGPAAQAPVPTVARRVLPQREAVTITAASSEHPLAHLVPSIDKFSGYVSRKVHGVLDLDLLSYGASKGENWLFAGPTETGKTGLIEAWCAREGRPLVTVPCNGGIDASTLFGAKTILPDGSIDYLYSNVTKAFKIGGVVYFDELNFAPGKVTAVIHSALDGRRQVTIADLGYLTFDLHPECFIVGAYNPGYADTRELNEATRRRFVEKVWDYDEEVEQTLVQQLPTLHEIKRRIRVIFSTGEVETPLGPAKLQAFENHAIDLNLDLAITLFLDSFKLVERDSVSEIVFQHRDRLERELEEIKSQLAA